MLIMIKVLLSVRRDNRFMSYSKKEKLDAWKELDEDIHLLENLGVLRIVRGDVRRGSK